MTLTIDQASAALAGLSELEPLWLELHATHQQQASFRPLVEDPAASWKRRRAFYESLLADNGYFFIARAEGGRPVGYMVVHPVEGVDGTFGFDRGVLQIVTIVVTSTERSRGVGQRLLDAAEAHARAVDCDAIRVAVMSGNHPAVGFYERRAYNLGEHVLYRKLD
jgi:ribosomal protein S18 acetylase RimI-like enzyme